MRGFDVGLEMSGAPAAFRDMIDNMYNGSKISLLGILPDTTTVDWNKIIFQSPDSEGHLRTRNVGNLVQNGANAYIRVRFESGDYTSFRY